MPPTTTTTTMATTGSTSSSSGSTNSLSNDASIDDATGLPTPMSECQALEDDQSFPMEPFPSPPEEFGPVEVQNGGQSPSPGRPTALLANAAQQNRSPRTILPLGKKPTVQWVRGLRTELTEELFKLRVETAEASRDIKDLLYETALLQSRLNKEITATNKAIESFRSMVDPRWVDFAMQKAQEAVETGVLEDFDDWLPDEDEEDQGIQGEEKMPIDKGKARETKSNNSLKRKRDDGESETESDIDAREAEEVELSITVPVSPGKRRKLSGESNDGYGSSISAVAQGKRRAIALGVSFATTNQEKTLVEASPRDVGEGTSRRHNTRGFSVVLPSGSDVQIAPITETSASARAPGFVRRPRAIVAPAPIAPTANGSMASPAQDTQKVETAPRRGGRPLRRQYQRVAQNAKGEPIAVDYRHRS
ncbi:hypothetical protein MD484_g7557, partial [Candolleomyces efflorescens]